MTGNSAVRGGAIALFRDGPVLDHCTIVGNVADRYGGGIYISLSYGSDTWISSSIVWGNGAEGIAGSTEYLQISYSDVHGGWPGEGNFDRCPLFCDAGCGAANDLTLAPASPCLGAGENGTDIGAFGLGCDARVGGGTVHVPEEVGTIAEALLGLCDCDTVMVAPGTYPEWGLGLGAREIVLTGSAPLDPRVVATTVIDARGAGPVIEVDGSAGRRPHIEGLTITGGIGTEGGGIVCQAGSQPRITRCAIVGNRSEGSGVGSARWRQG